MHEKNTTCDECNCGCVLGWSLSYPQTHTHLIPLSYQGTIAPVRPETGRGGWEMLPSCFREICTPIYPEGAEVQKF